MKKKQLSIYSLALASLLVLPLGSLTSCSDKEDTDVFADDVADSYSGRFASQRWFAGHHHYFEHGMGSLSQCNMGESECNEWCGKQYAYCDFGRQYHHFTP